MKPWLLALSLLLAGPASAAPLRPAPVVTARPTATVYVCLSKTSYA